MEQAQTSESASGQASNITDQEVAVKQEQVRLVADQDSTRTPRLDITRTSKMSQGLGKLEEFKQLKIEQCYDELLNN